MSIARIVSMESMLSGRMVTKNKCIGYEEGVTERRVIKSNGTKQNVRERMLREKTSML